MNSSAGLSAGVAARGDFEWARHLLAGPLNEAQRSFMERDDRWYWHTRGWCQVPSAELYVRMGSSFYIGTDLTAL